MDARHVRIVAHPSWVAASATWNFFSFATCFLAHSGGAASMLMTVVAAAGGWPQARVRKVAVAVFKDDDAVARLASNVRKRAAHLRRLTWLCRRWPAKAPRASMVAERVPSR
jgi:hypothetical protein